MESSSVTRCSASGWRYFFMAYVFGLSLVLEVHFFGTFMVEAGWFSASRAASPHWLLSRATTLSSSIGKKEHHIAWS